MAEIKIITDKCSGCSLCVKACPQGAIKIEEGKAVILDNCNLCGICLDSCNFDAIKLQRDKTSTKPLTDQELSTYKGVWVFAEQHQGQIRDVVYQLLGKGRELTDQLNTELVAILLGDDTDNITEAAKDLIAFGADKVYVVDSPSLRGFNDEIYKDILVQLVEKHKPEIFLSGATVYGRSLSPRIAARLNTGLTADCTGLTIDPDRKILQQTRPAFGGNLMATIICPDNRPQMATVRPGVMEAVAPDYSRKGKIIEPEINIPSQNRIEVKKIVTEIEQEVALTEAEIIIAAGKGIEGPDNLQMLEELAEVLGGVIGCSRAVVEAGWLDSSYQVGQSGKTVSPKLYFACGISGAIQHRAGMSSSDIIIAININPEAPIFDIANYGIVGDVKEVVPALTEVFKKYNNK